METTKTLQLNVSSEAFAHEEEIPVKYTCNGEGINPPLDISNIPDETQTLALIVEDPDAPGGTYDHWIVWNIDPVSVLKENFSPGISGSNSAGKTGYHPPCPPDGTHRYYFHVFALDVAFDLAPGASREELQQLMEPHILAKGTIMGRYGKTSNQ
ncbi:MAG: YbhB/YbcL family Raf kinase inhibitor-like protein [Agriterribacter sp.]